MAKATNLSLSRISKALLLLILLSFGLSSRISSQFQPTPVKKSNNIMTVGESYFYLHEVLKGQTLFGIAKEYQTTEDAIKIHNPELNQKTVYPGMVLRIPAADSVEKAAAGNDSAFLFHTVQAKENLYSISRIYGVKVEELKTLNPDSKTGLKIGQLVKIPKESITIAQATPAAVSQVIQDHGKEEARPVLEADRSCKIKPFPHLSDNFKLAVMLPLGLQQYDTLVYNDSLKAEQFRFYEFLEGLYLAIDSLGAEGLNITVEVFDTERDPKVIRKIISDNKLNQVDLIIGPVFPNEIEIVAGYSKTRHIPMVSPFSTFDLTKENPNAFQVRNPLVKQFELAAEYVGAKNQNNVILIGRLGDRKKAEFIKFQSNLASSIKENDPAKKAILKTIYFSETARSFMTADSIRTDLDRMLSRGTTNYIVLASEKEVFITEAINQLNQKAQQYDLHVFGLNQWVFSDLDLGSLFNVNLELYSDFDQYPFVDYTDAKVIDFCRKYKTNWNIEPSRYSFQGFDIGYFFTRALFLFGKNLTASVPCWPEYLNHPSLMTSMKFQREADGDGFRNKNLGVVRFKKNELVRVREN